MLEKINLVCPTSFNFRESKKSHFNYLDHNIHYLAFSETRINPSHTQTIYEIDHGFTHLVTHGRIDIVNTPGFRSSSAFQPGGIASAFHGKISNRYTKTIRGPAGRWVIHEFVGKEKPLRVYNVYRVNQKIAKQILQLGPNKSGTYKKIILMMILETM